MSRKPDDDSFDELLQDLRDGRDRTLITQVDMPSAAANGLVTAARNFPSATADLSFALNTADTQLELTFIEIVGVADTGEPPIL
jgi:hypothetical protein